MFPVKDNIPTRGFPLVTVALIVVNAIAYVLAIRHGGSIISGPDLREVYKYGAIPYALTHSGAHCAVVIKTIGTSASGTPITLCNTHLLAINHIGAVNPLPVWETVFTEMFMHASILHIAGNMLFLWIFGNTVEHALGRVTFLLFYVVAGVAALALQVAVDPSSTAPTLGASGAIAGVLGGYIVLYPRAKVLTVVFIVLVVTVIELPAWLMLGAWFAEQAIFGATSLTDPAGGGGAIAYFAHIGGFAFGLLTIKLLTRESGASLMRQTALLAVTLAFLVFLTGLVIVDVSEYGVHPLDVVAVPIIVFFCIAIVGALLRRPGR